MENKKYMELIRRIKSFSFATIDGDGLPDSRIIDVMFTEDDGIYFLTARGKNFYAQLMQQQFASITGMSDNWEAVTVRSRVKRIDRSYLERMFAENPSMHEMYPGESRSILEAFCLYEGQGELFDLSKVPIRRELFFIGNPAHIRRKGYVIKNDCTGCGLCAALCPQKCIDAGEPYVIRQQECLHCGYCAQECPADAIEKLR